MANEKHVRILLKGAEVWNKWREKHPSIRPDLRKARGSGAFLRGADLGNANLREAHLDHADLREANLRYAEER